MDSPSCTILIGKNNAYQEVSDGSCRLLDSTREQLLQMKLDDLAAPGTADITSAFNPSKTTECAHGLWLLVSGRAPGSWSDMNHAFALIS
jgi:hypothetical protein